MHLIIRLVSKRMAAFFAAVALLTVVGIGTQSSASAADASNRTCSKATSLVNLPTLKAGDSGPCVTYVQELLLSHEVMIGTSQPDGQFGPGTKSAVKNFQKWNKVSGGADGIVGPNTWTKLLKRYNNPVNEKPVC